MTSCIETHFQRPDLLSYRFKACVDWIQVEFTMPGECGWYWLHTRLSYNYVRVVGLRRRHRGARFCLRIQDPLCAKDVLCMLKNVGASRIKVTGIEIAVDMCPKTVKARDSMDWMAAHLLQGLKNPCDFARFGGYGPRCEQILSFEDARRRFAEGKCCYLGHRGDAHQQRIYVKKTDKGGVPLDPKDHRVRIENTYFDPQGLDGVLGDGLEQIIDPNDFAFRQLRDDLTGFQHMLASRAVQIGTRERRRGRVLFDANTVADTQLNRKVADALRGLNKRWAIGEGDAGIADEVSLSSEGNGAVPNNYFSINVELHRRIVEADIPAGAVSLMHPDFSIVRGYQGMLNAPPRSPCRGWVTKWDIAMSIRVLRVMLLRAVSGRVDCWGSSPIALLGKVGASFNAGTVGMAVQAPQTPQGVGGLKFEVRHRPTCKVSPKWEPTTRT